MDSYSKVASKKRTPAAIYELTSRKTAETRGSSQSAITIRTRYRATAARSSPARSACAGSTIAAIRAGARCAALSAEESSCISMPLPTAMAGSGFHNRGASTARHKSTRRNETTRYMNSSVFGAMPNSGTKKKKRAAIATLNVWAIRRVVERARRAKIIERFSYKPAIKKTTTHAINRSENGSRCATKNHCGGASNTRKKSDNHRASMKDSISPKKRTSVRGRKAVVIIYVIIQRMQDL